jgi:Tfp pilus assembly PilM family ATPase
MVRTGIDLGSGSIKVVRGEGGAGLERITHIGLEELNGAPSDEELPRASEALARLLSRLGLRRGRLGRLAVAIRGEDAGLREVMLPALSEAQLRQALPFEARKHLPLEDMASPILDCQILEEAVAGESEARMRVLLAAAPRPRRDFALKVLASAGLEPEVVDLEPLALLNALLAAGPFDGSGGGAVGLLDLGATQAGFAMTQPGGGLLARSLGAGTGSHGTDSSTRISRIAARAQETITFYRGRTRVEVGRLYLSGDGALETGLDSVFSEALGIPVAVFNPLEGIKLAESVDPALRRAGPRFATACGLCRWWDERDV